MDIQSVYKENDLYSKLYILFIWIDLGVFEFGYIPNNLLSSSSSAPFHYEHIRVVNRYDATQKGHCGYTMCCVCRSLTKTAQLLAYYRTATMERLRDLVPEMHARIAKKVRTDARMVEEFIGHFTPSGPSRPHTLGLCWTDLLVKYVCFAKYCTLLHCFIYF